MENLELIGIPTHDDLHLFLLGDVAPDDDRPGDGPA
jgi:hypothetical protein